MWPTKVPTLGIMTLKPPQSIPLNQILYFAYYIVISCYPPKCFYQSPATRTIIDYNTGFNINTREDIWFCNITGFNYGLYYLNSIYLQSFIWICLVVYWVTNIDTIITNILFYNIRKICIYIFRIMDINQYNEYVLNSLTSAIHYCF